MPETRVIGMRYTGGIVGMFSNHKATLQSQIQHHNNQGYRLRHVLPPKPGIAEVIVQMLLLSVTLLLWAPVPGETLIFEKDG